MIVQHLPVTVKGVLLRSGFVLLARNERHEWELPGGRPEPSDRDDADTVRREVMEETGLQVDVGGLLLEEAFAVVPGRIVEVRADRLEQTRPDEAPQRSVEHAEVAFVPFDALDGEQVPGISRRAIAAALAGRATG